MIREFKEEDAIEVNQILVQLHLFFYEKILIKHIMN